MIIDDLGRRTDRRYDKFPVGSRGRANGWITAVSLAGSSAGLLVAGVLLDHGWTYGTVMAMMGIGQLIAATIAFLAYPETAHLSLEQLNPEDRADLTNRDGSTVTAT